MYSTAREKKKTIEASHMYILGFFDINLIMIPRFSAAGRVINSLRGRACSDASKGIIDNCMQ